jgi:ABC-type transporter Mla subunit MlaD
VGDLTSLLSKISAETGKITAKVNQHTLHLNQLNKKHGGAKASEYRRIMLLASSDMSTFSKRVEDVLPQFEKNTQILEESFSAYVSLLKPESSHDLEQILNFRNSLTQMLSAIRPAKESTIGFRDSTISLINQNISQDLNKAASRQSRALDGVISNVEQVESFALRVIFLIDEKFGEPPASEDKAE